MASADGSVVIEVTLDDGTVRRQLARIEGDVSNLGDEGQRQTSRLGSAFRGLGVAAGVGAAAVAGLGAATFALGRPLVEAAASARALNAQFETVFGDLQGEATEALNSIGEEANILPSRLQGAFTQIAAFARTSGQSTEESLDLASRALRVSSDNAAFYDRSIQDVTESLQSFLKGMKMPAIAVM